MTSTGTTPKGETPETGDNEVDFKLEVVVIAVSDVARAYEFYRGLGWRVDADISRGDWRLVQMTPPGSPCSIQFGTDMAPDAPVSAPNLYLVVPDLERAREQLMGQGVVVSEAFHEGAPGGRFHAGAGRLSGPSPDHASYRSFATFSDPDGNAWLLQEITTRLPGRIDSNTTSYASVKDLSDAMRRASVAHGEHEKRIGQADANWPDWYAAYMVAEQAGTELPL